MGILSKIRNFFRRPGVQARFNAASLSRDAARNFAGSDYLSADSALTREVRLRIASRARNEYANNSFAYGIVTTLADDTIGTGPRLQLVQDGADIDLERNDALQRRERRFQAWALAVGLNDLLRRARIAKALDGETFIRILDNPGSGREVTIEPRLYETEFVASERWTDGPFSYWDTGEPREVDGVVYDRNGNPLQYRFLTLHPGGNAGATSEGRLVPSSQVVHYANLVRAGQHRGLSEMTAALNIFNDLRRYSTAVVLSAEVAAKLSFIISNDLPADAYLDTVETDESGHITRTALDIRGPAALQSGEFNSLVLPAGYHASQMKPEQPVQNYVSFKDSKIAEAARVFSMPFNVASGNSSSYNYASGRLDHQVYHKKLLIERETIASRILDRLLAAWEPLDQLLHPQDYAGEPASHLWMWDGFEHVDPVKEANAQAARLANGVTTMSEECAREGRDYLTVLRQRAREKAECERLGMAPPPWMNAPLTMAGEEMQQ